MVSQWTQEGKEKGAVRKDLGARRGKEGFTNLGIHSGEGNSLGRTPVGRIGRVGASTKKKKKGDASRRLAAGGGGRWQVKSSKLGSPLQGRRGKGRPRLQKGEKKTIKISLQVEEKTTAERGPAMEKKKGFIVYLDKGGGGGGGGVRKWVAENGGSWNA